MFFINFINYYYPASLCIQVSKHIKATGNSKQVLSIFPKSKGTHANSHAKIQGCHFSNSRCCFVCSSFSTSPWTSGTFRMIKCKPRKAGEELSALGFSQFQGSFIKKEPSFRCCACKCGFDPAEHLVHTNKINSTPGDVTTLDQMWGVPHTKHMWLSLPPSSNSLQTLERRQI